MLYPKIATYKKACGSNKGFTLIELTLVIIILGVMAVGIGGFITLSTQTYVNATNRDELIGNARFVIERLSREIRNAVPNSIRIRTYSGNQAQCVQFTPIVASTVYTDIPVSPEPASNTLSVIPFNFNTGEPYQCGAGCTDLVTVYPLDSDNIYDDYNTNNSGKIFAIDSVDTTVTPWEIDVIKTGGVTFTEDSPTQRLYITNEQVSYCALSGHILRYTELINHNDLSIIAGSGVYMAGYLNADISGQTVFDYVEPSLKRNAVLQMYFHFIKEDENYIFEHEIHIDNVP